MREPSFDRGLDEVGRQEGERDCHVDLANAEAFPGRNAFGICGRFCDKLMEPATPSCDRCDQESAVLGTHWAGVLRWLGCGQKYLAASSGWRLAPWHLQHLAAPRWLNDCPFRW